VRGLEAEACAGGAGLAHRRCPAGASCLTHNEEASAAASPFLLMEDGAIVTSEGERAPACLPTGRTSRPHP